MNKICVSYHSYRNSNYNYKNNNCKYLNTFQHKQYKTINKQAIGVYCNIILFTAPFFIHFQILLLNVSFGKRKKKRNKKNKKKPSNLNMVITNIQIVQRSHSEQKNQKVSDRQMKTALGFVVEANEMRRMWQNQSSFSDSICIRFLRVMCVERKCRYEMLHLFKR